MAVLFVLSLFLLSIVVAPARAATPATPETPNSGVTTATHPIEYHIACPPSMINDGSLDYFKAHGFSTVELIAPDQQPYKAELDKITSLGMRPIIDIETPIWSGGRCANTPIASYSAYFQSLKAAGWQYVASEGGRDGDCSYLHQFFKGYINYNCDQCGLWKDVYKDPFTVMNSWECYYPQEWQYIQQGAKEAASLGKQNGLLAGVWEYGSNGVSANPILTNSKNGGSPSYKSMLDWSYANGIGFTHFAVWCAYAQGLSTYKQLGFEQVVAQLQVRYPPTSSSAGPVPRPNQPVGSILRSTQLSFGVSVANPTVGKSIAFFGILKTTTSPSINVGSAKIALQYSKDKMNWSTASSSTFATSANGVYYFSRPVTQSGTYYYRAYYAGGAHYRHAYSPIVKVVAQKANRFVP